MCLAGKLKNAHHSFLIKVLSQLSYKFTTSPKEFLLVRQPLSYRHIKRHLFYILTIFLSKTFGHAFDVFLNVVIIICNIDDFTHLQDV